MAGVYVVKDGVLQSFSSLSVARGSDAKYFDSAGVLQTASSNVARTAYHPTTNALLGLDIEEARTNLCLYSEDLSNAAWVASNVTKGSTSVTAPDGTSNTTCELTASAGNGTCLQTVTSAIDDYAYSVFMKRKTGTGDIDLTCDNGVTWTTKTLTSEWQRFEISDASETNPVVGVRIVTSGDAIHFWGNQLEKNTVFASSYIGPTTTGSVSRSADVFKITDVTDILPIGSDFTLYYKYRLKGSYIYGNSLGGFYRTASWSTDRWDHTFIANNRETWYCSTTAGGVQASLSPYSLGNVSIYDGEPVYDVLGMTTNDAAAILQGGTAITDAACVWSDTLADFFGIGMRGNNLGQLNGYIETLIIYPERLTDSQMQTLSEGGSIDGSPPRTMGIGLGMGT